MNPALDDIVSPDGTHLPEDFAGALADVRLGVSDGQGLDSCAQC